MEVDIQGRVSVFNHQNKMEFVFCDSEPEMMAAIGEMLLYATGLAKAKRDK
jgi:hypothetical protein